MLVGRGGPRGDLKSPNLLVARDWGVQVGRARLFGVAGRLRPLACPPKKGACLPRPPSRHAIKQTLITRRQVGDFNLSRYMSRDDAFIKSSLENNPRWSAPEVVVEGRFSKVRVCAGCFVPKPGERALLALLCATTDAFLRLQTCRARVACPPLHTSLPSSFC